MSHNFRMLISMFLSIGTESQGACLTPWLLDLPLARMAASLFRMWYKHHLLPDAFSRLPI